MPPRFAYWTIIADGLPTAFRAKDRDELMPTFQRLKENHPDAEMKWFARGKLWDSPEAARPPRREFRDDRMTSRGPGRHPLRDDERRRGAGSFASGAGSSGRARGHGANAPGSRAKPGHGEFRGRDWRPGGEHRDPRQTFKDAKKGRNQRWREEKFAHKQRFADKPVDRGGPSSPPDRDRSTRPPHERPHGDNLRPKPRWEDRPRRDQRHDGRPQERPFGDRSGGPSASPRGDWKNRPPRERPHGDALRGKPGGEDRPRRDQRHDGRPQERAFSDRNGGPSASPRGDWKNRPPREKPHGDALRGKPGGEDRARRDQRQDWRPAKPPRDDRPRGEKRPDARPSTRPFTDRRGDASRPPYTDRMAPNPDRPPRKPGPFGPGGMTERPPREKLHGDRPRAPASRPFAGHGRFERNQGTEEPKAPPVPSSPNREPRPDENPEPSAPPHPNEPAILPPGPPERGRSNTKRRRDR